MRPQRSVLIHIRSRGAVPIGKKHRMYAILVDTSASREREGSVLCFGVMKKIRSKKEENKLVLLAMFCRKTKNTTPTPRSFASFAGQAVQLPIISF